MYACGYCGCPCDKRGNQLETPKNYNPKNYKQIVCRRCAEELEAEKYIRITRDMAIDAGDMDLEGQLWRW